MDKSVLEDLGLTRSESSVYLAMLELGKASAGKIVSHAGISSSKIYEILDKLQKKGLVSYIIESGVKYFEASEPERIFDLIEEKEKEIQSQREKINELVPYLKERQLLSKYKSEATIYKGMKGLRAAFQGGIEKLKKGEEFLAMSMPKRSELVNKFFVKFSRDLKFKNIGSRLIFNESARGEEQTTKGFYKNIKYLPETTPAAIYILGNRTIIFPNEVKEDFILIVIDNIDIAKSFRVQFEKLWEQDFEIRRGVLGAQEAFNVMLDELDAGDEYYVLGASWAGMSERIDDFYVDFHKRREAKGVKAKILFVQEAQKLNEDIKKCYGKLAEIRFLSEGNYEGVQFNLYKNKLLMFVWREKEPFVFSIEDKGMHATFKAYFDTHWNSKTKILKGLSAVEDLFNLMLEEDEAMFIGARGYFVDRSSKFIDDWEKRAISKKFKFRNMVDSETQGHRITKFPFAQTKYSLNQEFSKLSVIWIFGTKVAISNWSEDEPSIVIIDDKKFNETYRSQFESLWNQKTTIFNSQKGLEIAYNDLSGEVVVFAEGDNDLRWLKEVKGRVLYYGKTSVNMKRAKEYVKRGIDVRIYDTQEVLGLSTIVAGDTVLNIIDQVELIKLDNKVLASNYKKNFEVIWKQAKKV